jgi:hypothetical protein
MRSIGEIEAAARDTDMQVGEAIFVFTRASDLESSFR